MKNIVLIGMMGCGKSTLGALLAKELDRELVDTDAFVEQRSGRSIPEIFSSDGEACFRDLEQDAARELSHRESLIVACGGGLPLREDGMECLKASGIVIWLHRDPGETYDTMDHSGRPLAQQGREDFLARFAQREPIYRRWADYVIDDFSSPQTTLNKILEVLK